MRTQQSSLPGSQVIQLSEFWSWRRTDICFSGRQYQRNCAPTLRKRLRQRMVIASILGYSASSSMNTTISWLASIRPCRIWS